MRAISREVTDNFITGDHYTEISVQDQVTGQIVNIRADKYGIHITPSGRFTVEHAVAAVSIHLHGPAQ